MDARRGDVGIQDDLGAQQLTQDLLFDGGLLPT